MSDQQAFERLKDFFENRKASSYRRRPFAAERNVEIGVIINDGIECAFFKENNQPKFEQRAANRPDVIFYINPDAILMSLR